MLNMNLLAESHGAACVDASPEGPWIDAAGHSVPSLGAACPDCGYAITPSSAHLHAKCAPPDAADLLAALDDVTSAGIMPDGRTRKMWFQRRDEAGLPVGNKIMLVGESFEAVLRKYARHTETVRAIARAGRAS